MMVPNIPNGIYELLIEGVDGRNQFFLSFSLPAAGDPNCEACQGDVTELTLQFLGDDLPAQDNGDPGLVTVVTNQGDMVFRGSQPEFVVPDLGSLTGSTSIDVFLNGKLNTTIPTVWGHPANGEVERGSALSGSQIWFPVRLSI